MIIVVLCAMLCDNNHSMLGLACWCQLPRKAARHKHFPALHASGYAGLGEFISGVILYEETLFQDSPSGVPIVDLFKQEKILLGIKVDKGAIPLYGTDAEVVIQGLDGLAERCQKYYARGARFAKWLVHCGVVACCSRLTRARLPSLPPVEIVVILRTKPYSGAPFLKSKTAELPRELPLNKTRKVWHATVPFVRRTASCPLLSPRL